LTPTDTAVAPLVNPETCTGTALLVVEPFPSCPSLLEPQHSTPPPLRMAHAELLPTEIEVTEPVNPVTGTGELL
jgi:hypothetical protein